jgi:hypothetical protein
MKQERVPRSPTLHVESAPEPRVGSHFIDICPLGEVGFQATLHETEAVDRELCSDRLADQDPALDRVLLREERR